MGIDFDKGESLSAFMYRVNAIKLRTLIMTRAIQYVLFNGGKPIYIKIGINRKRENAIQAQAIIIGLNWAIRFLASAFLDASAKAVNRARRNHIQGIILTSPLNSLREYFFVEENGKPKKETKEILDNLNDAYSALGSVIDSRK